jgi:short subunit dehydrogenase-like uncharacterized protein
MVSMVAGQVLIYGSTGFTGKLVLERLVADGLHPLACGRDAARVRSMAQPLGLEWRLAPVTDPRALDAALRDVRVVLNAAGPFADTALPIAEAAARVGAHYLDVCGEVDVIESLAQRHAWWRRHGIMAMPAVGFDVVPSDCLSVLLARECPGASTLRIGVQGLYLISRGSAETLAREWGRETRLRRDGRLCSVAPGALVHAFDYGDGPCRSVLVSWGDAASAYYSTGIPNIETYFAASVPLDAVIAANRIGGPLLSTAPAQALISAWHGLLPSGPSVAMRKRVETVVVAEIENQDGARRAVRVRAGDSYEFTALSASLIVQRVLAGAAVPGFQTPARAFGPELLSSLPASAVERI